MDAGSGGRLSSSTMNERIASKARFVGRYIIAAHMIPVGVAFGVGGLVQNWSRSLRNRRRRTEPTPQGYPEGSGLRKVGPDAPA